MNLNIRMSFYFSNINIWFNPFKILIQIGYFSFKKRITLNEIRNRYQYAQIMILLLHFAKMLMPLRCKTIKHYKNSIIF